jgi:hypothetical protein
MLVAYVYFIYSYAGSVQYVDSIQSTDANPLTPAAYISTDAGSIYPLTLAALLKTK